MSHDFDVYHHERIRADALFDMVVRRDARIKELEAENQRMREGINELYCHHELGPRIDALLQALLGGGEK